MKNVFIKSLGLVLALSACQKENNEIGYTDIEEPVSVSFSSQISRVEGTQWEPNDKVGISATDGNSVNYTNVKYLSDASGNFSVPEGGEPICYQNQNAMSFTAYYPYSETISDGVISGNTLDNNKKCNYLWAQVSNVQYSSSPTVNFTFNHSMSELRIELTFPEGTDVSAYKNVTISGLKHDGNFNINTGVASPDANAIAEDWLVALSGEGTTLSYRGVIYPQAVSGMVLKMNDVDYNINFKDTEEFVAGKYYTISAEINADGSVKVSMKVNGATIDDYKDGGNANIAFLSSAASAAECDDEAKAAYDWLKANYTNVTYVAVSENRDMSEFDLVWAHLSKNSNDFNIENMFTIDDNMKTYYTKGGKIIASMSAIMSAGKWGITKDADTPDNNWEISSGTTSDIYVNEVSHPIFKDITMSNRVVSFTFNAASKVYQWRNFADGASDLFDWANNTGGICLASDKNYKDITVRVSEFRNGGHAILIGDPFFTWNNADTESETNLIKFTKNTIEYLLNL